MTLVERFNERAGWCEKVIDGVLHFRMTPDAKWTPCSPEQLTDRVVCMSESSHLNLMSKNRETVRP